MNPNPDFISRLDYLLKKDPLDRNYNLIEKINLLVCRSVYKTEDETLEIFLSAIDWTDPDHIKCV